MQGKPSLADQLINDVDPSINEFDSFRESEPDEKEPADLEKAAHAVYDSFDSVAKAPDVEEEPSLPAVEAYATLHALGQIVTSADGEAVEFFVASAVAKLWMHAFRSPDEAVAQVEAFQGNEYAERARTRFLDEYREAKSLPLPAGYAFTVDGLAAEPNLMQRLVTVRVRDRRRVGNWSGTGAGKTLSAVLASRAVDARLTIICCPNAVVGEGVGGEGWAQAIRDIFPDSVVATKTFEPQWSVLEQDSNRILRRPWSVAAPLSHSELRSVPTARLGSPAGAAGRTRANRFHRRG